MGTLKNNNMNWINICTILFIHATFIAQEIKFNSATGLVSPIGVYVNITSIDSVKKYFGKNYKVKKDHYDIIVEYENGLSFGYFQPDSALRVTKIIINEKARVQTTEGIIPGKTTVEEVLKMIPDAKIYGHPHGAYVSTKYFNCYIRDKKKELQSTDQIVKIIKDGSRHDSNVKQVRFSDNYISRKTPENNSLHLLDSLLIKNRSVNLNDLDIFLDKFNYNEKYYNINFQKYDDEANEFGYENVFADAFFSNKKISYFFMTKNDRVIFFVSEDNKRTVVIKDNSLFKDFLEKYTKLHDKEPDFNDLVIVPMDSPHFVGFAYEKDKDEIEKDSIGKRYMEYSKQLASLNAETQAAGIEGFFYLKGLGTIVAPRDKEAIDFLGHSKKTLKVTSYYGCFSHTEEKNFRKLVRRYQRGKSFPRGYHRTYSFGPGMIR